jgi:hypothetical protein
MGVLPSPKSAVSDSNRTRIYYAVTHNGRDMVVGYRHERKSPGGSPAEPGLPRPVLDPY